METNLADVFAAGDCVETYHRLLARPVSIPLGTTAHKQGRVAGENAAGGLAEFQGSLGTQVVKVFGGMAASSPASEPPRAIPIALSVQPRSRWPPGTRQRRR